ncbi:unnamed protein product [Oppiella nova]|uniref:C3H1-type domain-containing protein n=1 Tax=Oppiella nova TaxID=334625 RepID=A0A7R9QVW3_9ACAR|nr:unnamed protein product [Oppiella nova]CAG2176300.1 unnamed protein product [Oppiella nova]
MPPKKDSGASKKTEIKKKEKIIEDKTFGLKNKKGTKQQKFIQQVANQVKQQGLPKKVRLAATYLTECPINGGEIAPNTAVVKKEEKKKQLEELNALFRPVTAAQKVDKGVDPKSVLCAFFKSGQCGKGDKCKFSHDVTVERKSEKKNVYVDARQEDTMDDWDDEKLKEVVEKKENERKGSESMEKHSHELDDKNGSEEYHKYQTDWFEFQVFFVDNVFICVRIDSNVFSDTEGPIDVKYLFIELKQKHDQNEQRVQHKECKHHSIPKFFEFIGNPFLMLFVLLNWIQILRD